MKRDDCLINNNDISYVDRKIYLFGEINNGVAKEVIQKINLINDYDDAYEEEQISELKQVIDPNSQVSGKIQTLIGQREPIYLEINSNGGEAPAGYSIISAIEASSTPVIGYVSGNCMSMAVAILASCDLRIASEYSEFMIHDVYSGMEGKYSDLNSTISYIGRVRENYNKVLVKHTKLTEAEVNELVSKSSDHYFSPIEAQKMGIVDELEVYVANDDSETTSEDLHNSADEEDIEDIEKVVSEVVSKNTPMEDYESQKIEETLSSLSDMSKSDRIKLISKIFEIN